MAPLSEAFLDLPALLNFIGADDQHAFVVDESLVLRWASATLNHSRLFTQVFDQANRSRPVTLRAPSELAAVVRERFAQPLGQPEAPLADIGCECKVSTLLPTAMHANGSQDERPKLVLVLLTPRERMAGSVSPSQLDLTRVEYELVLHIMSGKNVRQAAECMRISYHTARKYLQNVFTKTGVKRQAELVAHISQRMSQLT